MKIFIFLTDGNFQQLSQVFLGVLTLKFLICITRHLPEHTGEEIFW